MKNSIKIALVILTGSAVFLFLFSVGKKFLSAIGLLDNQGDKDKKELDKKILSDVDDEIKNCSDDLSFSPSVYPQYVSKIVLALDNIAIDDQDSVRDVFHQMKNRRDVLELVKTFGVQASKHSIVSQGFAGGIALWISTGNTFMNDLTGDVNKILSDNKISYTF